MPVNSDKYTTTQGWNQVWADVIVKYKSINDSINPTWYVHTRAYHIETEQWEDILWCVLLHATFKGENHYVWNDLVNTNAYSILVHI